MLTILPPNENTISQLNQVDARYLAGELIQVRVTRKGFVPEYTPLNTAEWRQWPVWTNITVENVLAHKSWACFFAFLEERFVGQLVAAPAQYALCRMLDLRVDASVRRQGVGTELLNACMDWAGRKKMKGLWVDIDDQNPVACQFLQRSQFSLGGVDKLRHFADPAQADRPAAMRDSVLSFYRFLG